jgi:hypothetical protein
MRCWPQFDNSGTLKRGNARGVIIDFWVCGPLGVAAFGVQTGWVLKPFMGPPGLSPRYDIPGLDRICADVFPTARSVSVHSPIRRHGMIGDDTCPYQGDIPCWNEGSHMEGDRLLKMLVEHGSDAVYERLAEWYGSIEDREPCEKDGCHGGHD